jgi:dTDP-4-dehydrorhamnose 3,5-epimerase
MSDELFGVSVLPLRRIPDERGMVMHMLRSTDPHFDRFGEIYFSAVDPKVIKGWHGYKTKALSYTCVHGMVELVLYDNREWSETYQQIQQIFLGDSSYVLVIIPPGIFNAFRGLSTFPSIVAVCATEPFDEEKMFRLPLDTPEIPFEWSHNGK